jgi:intraflagellar transport protein 74
MQRQGTALRPMGLAPTGQGFGTQVPGTAMRPPTGALANVRLGTAARPSSRGGGAVPGAIPNVADRPITQQGMMGMQQQVQGPGRQVLDKSYWVATLRRKIDEIASETANLLAEKEKVDKDALTHSVLEKKFQVLVKDVKDKRGQLSDLNHVLELSGSNSDTSELVAKTAAIKQSNEVEQKRIDQVFLEKKSVEREIARLEQLVNEHLEASQQLMQQLSPSDRHRYVNLQRQHAAITDDINRQRSDYDDTCRQLGKMEAQLQADPLKQKLNKLQEEHEDLVKVKAELLQDGAQELTIDQQRERLLDQVKEDNKNVAYTTRKIKELQDEIKRLSDEITKYDDTSAASSRSGPPNADEPTREQIEALRRGEVSMNEFLSNYEIQKASVEQANERLRRSILSLLEFSSREAGGLASELAYKETRLEQSATTAQRLTVEYDNRVQELEKIKSLDVKIAQELEQLQTKRNAMEADIKSFADTDGLRKRVDEAQGKLLVSKKNLVARKEALRQQLANLSSLRDAQKLKLMGGDALASFEGLEQKMQHHEKNIFHLRDFIDAKVSLQHFFDPVSGACIFFRHMFLQERECDYTSTLQDVSTLIADINEILCSLYNH